MVLSLSQPSINKGSNSKMRKECSYATPNCTLRPTPRWKEKKSGIEIHENAKSCSYYIEEQSTVIPFRINSLNTKVKTRYSLASESGLTHTQAH